MSSGVETDRAELGFERPAAAAERMVVGANPGVDENGRVRAADQQAAVGDVHAPLLVESVAKGGVADVRGHAVERDLRGQRPAAVDDQLDIRTGRP